MIKFNPKTLSVIELLRCYADILDELKSRGVTRTLNNPVSDYAEWLVSENLKLSLESNSKAGYDGIDSRGNRYQIKSRRLDSSNKTRVLGVIRNLKEKNFDYLIAVLFDKRFNVKEAYKIPHEIIEKYAYYNKHQNGHILHMRGPILKDPLIEDIAHILGG